MKFSAFLFAATLFFVVGTGVRAQSATSSELKLDIRYHKLPNGMRVALMPDPDEKEVAIEFWIALGARDEAEDLFGFAHFFEHATPYGLQRNEAERLRFRSGLTNSNAQARKDYVRYYIQVRPEVFDLGLQYVFERLTADPDAILPDNIENHRKNVLAEMTRNDANPFFGPTASAAREEAIYGKSHPYGHSTYGTFDLNRGFTTDQVRAWYRSYVVPRNVILFIAGNFDAGKTRTQLNSTFAKIKNRPSKPRRRNAKPTPSRERITVKAPVPSHHVSLVWPIPEWSNRDVIALEVLASVIDSHGAMGFEQTGSSNLFESWQWAGRFGVYASIRSLLDRERAFAELALVVSRAASVPFSDAEIEAAKSRLIANIMSNRSRLGFIGSRIEMAGEGILYKNDPQTFQKRLKLIRTVRSIDIQRAARRWLAGAGSEVLIVSAANCDDPGSC